MRILGLSHPVGADPAACIIQEGRLVAFCEEERFTRQKHALNALPRQAIRRCLEIAELNIADLDEIVVGFARPGPRRQTAPIKLHEKLGDGRSLFDFHDTRLKSFLPRIRHIDHYRAHALSVAPHFGDRPANILAIDGWGGDHAGSIFYTSDGCNLRQLLQIPVQYSLGLFFQFVTAHLGFEPHSDEGKTMALAAYGEVDGQTLPDWCDTETGLPDVSRYLAYLESRKPRRPEDKIQDEHRRIAATAQYYLERAILRLARWTYERTKCRNFGMSGGVALNCIANGGLAREEFVDELIVTPVANDAGTALGAAVAAYIEYENRLPLLPTQHAYWGPNYSLDQVTAALAFAQLRSASDDPVGAAVSALCEGKTVGLFVGNAEVGPRALGARTILANPTAANIRDYVNARVKRREPWRPFAPAVLESHASTILEHGCATPFMTVADRISEAWRERLPGVVHVNGTTRAQLVSAGHNHLFYSILLRFYELTGIPALLNTSFNLNDEPIVQAPDHAIATFFRSGLDVLVFENAVLRKEI